MFVCFVVFLELNALTTERNLLSLGIICFVRFVVCIQQNRHSLTDSAPPYSVVINLDRKLDTISLPKIKVFRGNYNQGRWSYKTIQGYHFAVETRLCVTFSYMHKDVCGLHTGTFSGCW